MAISVAHLTTNFDLTNQNTAYSTASISPTAGRLIILCINGRADHGGAPQDPSSISGNSLSWSKIDSLVYRNSGSFTWGTMWIYAADTGGAPSTGAISIDPVETQSNMSWSVFECDGTDVAGGVAQCFVQVVKSTVNTQADPGSSPLAELTLAAASDADNRPFMFNSIDSDQGAIPRTNWSEIGDTVGHTENIGIETEWRSDTFEATTSATFTGPVYWGGMAWELKAAGGAAVADSFDPMGMMGFFGA